MVHEAKLRRGREFFFRQLSYLFETEIGKNVSTLRPFLRARGAREGRRVVRTFRSPRADAPALRDGAENCPVDADTDIPTIFSGEEI